MHMKCLGPLVIFSLDALRFAVALEDVERFVRAAEITELPKAPVGIRDISRAVLTLHLRLASLPIIQSQKPLSVKPCVSFALLVIGY
jgi:hypothetical protein